MALMANAPKSYLIDMDGVLVRGSTPIPGADLFLARLAERSAEYLVLTNNPLYTQNDLAYRLASIGLAVERGPRKIDPAGGVTVMGPLSATSVPLYSRICWSSRSQTYALPLRMSSPAHRYNCSK